jgi:hypothetical protein
MPVIDPAQPLVCTHQRERHASRRLRPIRNLGIPSSDFPVIPAFPHCAKRWRGFTLVHSTIDLWCPVQTLLAEHNGESTEKRCSTAIITELACALARQAAQDAASAELAKERTAPCELPSTPVSAPCGLPERHLLRPVAGRIFFPRPLVRLVIAHVVHLGLVARLHLAGE